MRQVARAEDHAEPTLAGAAIFQCKLAALQVRRAIRNVVIPVAKHRPSDGKFGERIAYHSSHLTSPGNHDRDLELGKIQNLRVAARRLDGIIIPAESTFSFWRQVGKCLRRKGYVSGRQLQEGCLIPAVGGGICQLSNALYDVALQAGCQIVERHPHSRIIPGSAAASDRDATVAWNHIDLRWKSAQAMQLRVRLSETKLEVELRAAVSSGGATMPSHTRLRTVIDVSEHSCGTCSSVDCRLFPTGLCSRTGETTYLLDEYWPEFDAYISSSKSAADTLMIPMKGRPAYRWSTESFGRVEQARLETLWRSIRSRKLAGQGAERQKARLAMLEALANRFVRQIPYSASHMVVSLDFLPFVWRSGALGGRTFDVLMTRFPIKELQRRLDDAQVRFPERTLLGDFRAPQFLTDLENEALAHADRLITPHRAIAASDERRVLLDWSMPEPMSYRAGTDIVFPGPTVARKGAYEVRALVGRLDLPVQPLGSELEGSEFWAGVSVVRDSDWLSNALVVIQPAVLEDKPRRLLRAIASGCPVIATAACGLPDHPLVTIVEEGNVDEMCEAVERIRARPLVATNNE